MKVVFTIASMQGGGSERVLAILSNYIANKGHDVTILMTVGGKIEYPLDERIKCISLSGQTGGKIGKRIERIKQLRAILKEDKEQIIVSFGTETNLFSIISSLGLPNRLVVSERNDPNQCKYKMLRNIIYRFAKCYVFQTKEAQNHFSKTIQKNSCVIPNPMKKDLPISKENEEVKSIVTVGRLEAQKNHTMLLHAFWLFVQNHMEYQLVIYGKGELEHSLKEVAKELTIEEKVTFKGFSTNVLEEIKDATMFVLSSDYEGISNSLMEAMGIGLPVISTDCPIGGSAGLINHGENGILVPIGDCVELSKAMNLLAKDKEYRRKLGRNAQKLREELTEEKICQEWVKVICKQ